MRPYNTVTIIVFVVAIIVALVFSLAAGLMVDSNQAIRAAESLGYSDIKIVNEQRIWPSLLSGCSKSDAAAFDLVATNAAGKPASLTMCVGWPFKGATPRFN